MFHSEPAPPTCAPWDTPPPPQRCVCCATAPSWKAPINAAKAVPPSIALFEVGPQYDDDTPKGQRFADRVFETAPFFARPT